jgi:hypothetical protein
MVSIANWFTIAGIIIQTGVLIWAAKDVFSKFGKYYDKSVSRDESNVMESYNRMKKEQRPILIALVIAALLQIIALII